jgi:GntR family transcriptional regulator/MocR family aminotransferase
MIIRRGEFPREGSLGEKCLGSLHTSGAGGGMELLFEIELERAAKGSRESAASLYRQLKAAIVDRRLPAGTQLPPARQALRFFGVSRNTAIRVYERLLHEGYVVARHGSGTFVAKVTVGATPRKPTARRAKPEVDPRLNQVWLCSDVTDAMGFWNDQPEPHAGKTRSVSVDFRPALIDSRLFPLNLFRKIIARQLRGLEKRPPRYKSPQGNQGNYHLRDAIARHIALTRATVCRPDEIVVTSGAQQAFDLLARVLVKPNVTIVAIEDPGYPPMRAAFAAAGAKLVPTPVDAEGLVLENLPSDVGVICVCPSHQFPLGVTMSERRRHALVELARKRGAVIIEDDYDGEFRHDGSPLKSLRAVDPADVVFYVGTFSKCMLPALRLGFIVAPPWAMQALVVAKNCSDWHCPVVTQLAVSGFIADGHLARHVRKMRRVYQERRDFLLGLLQRDLVDWLEPIPSSYGMHIAAIARSPMDLDQIADELLDGHVNIHSLARYYVGDQPKTGLVFGYGAADRSQISHGLTVLRKVLSNH